MTDYAMIVVDIAVASAAGIYSYEIPPHLKSGLEIGNAVLVPFGRRNIKGFVVGFTANPDFEIEKIKPIVNKITEEKFFDREILALCQWMVKYYHSFLIKAIKTVIPTGVLSGKVRKKKKSYVMLNCDRVTAKKFINDIKNKAPSQAAVLEYVLNKKNENYTVKDLSEAADSYRGAIYKLIDKGYLKYYNLVQHRRPHLEKNRQEAQKLQPTPAQKKAITEITNNLDTDKAGVFLLHGVTGSGKTEVYLNIIEKVLKKGKAAIVLVPEISLTPVMVRRFYSRFGDKIAVFHSSLSLGERYDEWRRLQDGKARVVIGARSAIFAPVNDLDLIVIDEEHENSYKQNKYPHYHARRIARKRIQMNNATLVLGSATPSLESYFNAQNKIYRYLTLPQRIQRPKMPPVKIVDMRDELKKGNTTIFSSSLRQAIKRALENSEQILLFLNRRGYSNFVLCRDCGYVVRCENCDISLTYHTEENKLRCHYCDYFCKLPQTCPQCGSRYIKDFGIGTQKIEEKVKEEFPRARVERMDVDTTTRKGSHNQILKNIENGKTDILVGTQMIAKGHDYPNISVVGVITADTILNLPDFRSSERTFQLLTQVSGRTGRGSIRGQVIIQTYTPEHYSIEAAANHDYSSFYSREIKLREELQYPPFIELVNIIVQGENEDKVIKTATDLGLFLNKYREEIHEVLGPSEAPLARLRKKYRWQLILKFTDRKPRDNVLNKVEEEFLVNTEQEIHINIDVEPQRML